MGETNNEQEHSSAQNFTKHRCQMVLDLRGILA